MVFSTHPSPRWVKRAFRRLSKTARGGLEVLFGVGFGGGDTLERLVQDADNPPLFGEQGYGNCDFLERAARQLLEGRSVPTKFSKSTMLLR